MSQLSSQKCEACNVDATKVSDDELQELLAQIPDWVPEVRDGVMMLERVYTFKNYKQAWAFANKVSMTGNTSPKKVKFTTWMLGFFIVDDCRAKRQNNSVFDTTFCQLFVFIESV